MKKLIALVAALSVAATLEAVQAQFSYQGVLKNTNNSPMTGTHVVQLRLYNVATGGSALWGRKYNVQLDSSTGLFNIEVSDSTGSAISGLNATLESVFAQTDTLYIGLKVDDTSGEISPRQKLLPVPYAAFASNVSRASGDFTVAGKLKAANAEFTGAVSADSLSVKKTLTAAGAVSANGGATVSGNLKVTGTISGTGTVPIGAIIMWSGTNVPDGWALCNGQGGTPDLRDRFIVGAGSSYGVGSTGGANTVALSSSQIPSHAHNYSFRIAGLAGAVSEKYHQFYYVNEGGGTGSRTTNAAGGGQAHENRPPYYALAFIMRKN